MSIHFIDIAQGDSTLIRCPDGTNILIDCGSTSAVVDVPAVRRYLRSQLDPNHFRIDYLVITHADADHYNQLSAVLNQGGDQDAIGIGEIILIHEVGDHWVNDTDSWIGSVGEYTILDHEDHDSYPPEALGTFGGVTLSIVAAGVYSNNSTKNAASIVLMATFGEFDALLMGDATEDTMKYIVERYEGHESELDIEVLKIAHHGSRSTAWLHYPDHDDEYWEITSPWFDYTTPQVAIYSSGYTNQDNNNNKYGHPALDTANALAVHTIPAERHRLFLFDGRNNRASAAEVRPYRDEAIFSTGSNGNIRLETDGQSYWWSYDQ